MAWRKVSGMSMYSPEPKRLRTIGEPKQPRRRRRKRLKVKPVYLRSYASEAGVFGKKAVKKAKNAVESARLFRLRHMQVPKKGLYDR